MSTTSSEPADITRGHLVESHLPLVHSLARRYVGRGESLDDLVQVGAVGLIKASNRFDERRGVAFAAFAAPAIDGEIRRHLRDRSSALRIPRALQQTSEDVRRHGAELAAALGRTPTVGELATALDADEHEVKRALDAERARDAVPLTPDSDRLELPDTDQARGSEERLLLTPSVRALEEPARTIVFLRFHADMTERQIARELGISQAHVSRLLSSALERLRSELADSGDGISTGDTAENEVISPPSRARAASAVRKRKGALKNVATRKTRIGPVGGSHENRALEDYLELPYNLAVKYERDGEPPCWSASVAELPGCTARGRTPDQAVDLLRPAMEAWLKSALAEHREIPEPAAPGDEPVESREVTKQRTSSSHSGRFLVRMSGTLHEELAGAAERQQVSLNKFVTDALAASVSPPAEGGSSAAAQPDGETIESATGSEREPPRSFRLALATNLAVVVFAGAVAVVLLVLALQRGL
jgi:RNA polymerase sigma-B factor